MRLGISGGRRRWRLLPVIAAVVFLAAIFVGVRLHSVFASTARAYANNAATTAISNSVYEIFSGDNGRDFTETTSIDRVTVLTTDTARINMLNSRIAERIQSEVLESDYKTVYIPLGSVSGIAAFSGMGVKIPVKIHPISLVNTDVDEKFESCGINQVRHTVGLNVEIVMAYSGYLFSEKETVQVSVPVMDSVIVGDIPEFYGGGEILAEDELKNDVKAD